MRKLVSSGSPYEPKVGISRAVRAGPIVTVAGTAPLGPDGTTVGRGDPAAQARRCLDIIAAALEGAGASLRHVVRTRILLTCGLPMAGRSSSGRGALESGNCGSWTRTAATSPSSPST